MSERPKDRVDHEVHFAGSKGQDKDRYTMVFGFLDGKEIFSKKVRQGNSLLDFPFFLFRRNRADRQAREAIVWRNGIPRVPENLITQRFEFGQLGDRYRELTSNHVESDGNILTEISSYYIDRKGNRRRVYDEVLVWKPEKNNRARRHEIETMQNQALRKSWRGLVLDTFHIATGEIVTPPQKSVGIKS